MPLPVWLAVSEQVPGAATVTVLAETVQIPVVFEETVTGKPEVAVGLTPNGATPSFSLGIALKVIVWLALLIVKDCCA